MADKPQLGDHVLYMLTDHDVRQINARRRMSVPEVRGSRAQAGDICPGVIVRVWDTNVNLQVHLDGSDTYWVTSAPAADQPKPGHYTMRA